MSETDLPKESLSTHHHYQEEEWEVWELKPNCSSQLPIVEDFSSYYKLAKFYIKDILKSQLTDDCDQFVFRDRSFVYVHLSGTIVIQSIHKEKLCLEVSDGTGIITCLLDENILKKIKEVSLTYSKEIEPRLKDGTNKEVSQAILINYGALRNIFKYIPRQEDLRAGETVSIIGKLKEHNGKKYVFVSKIKIISITEFMEDLEDKFKIYSNYFN